MPAVSRQTGRCLFRHQHQRTLGPHLVAAVVLSLNLLMTVGNSVASTGTSSSTGVLAIAQTHRVTAQGTFTVSVQVANPASVHYAFFTFCQLSSPVCYTPVEMNLTNSNWFVGTTRPMTSYPGMRVGVSAGFNITLEYPNNLNVTEPALPNAFANLTVANSVSGEFFFEMTVNDQVYALGGIVHDAATGARLSDASVTLELAPGDNNTTTTSSTGSFSFAGVPNGTYQMAVSAPGYASGSQMVRVDGNNVLTDVPLTHAAKASPPWWAPGGSIGGVPLIFVGFALVVVALAAGLWLRRQRSMGAPRTAAPETPSGPPPPRSD